MSALELDAGALIAIDRRERDLRALCDAAGNKAVVVDC